MAATGKDFPAMETDGGVVFCAITLPGLVLNALAVAITIKVAKRQAVPPNIFISTLACTDLFGLLIVTVPTLLAYSYGSWVGGEILCKAQGVTSILCIAASGLVAVLISLDRFLAVALPFWYYKNRNHHFALKWCVVTVFAISIFLSLLPLMALDEIVTWRYPGTYCTFNNFSRQPQVRGFALAFTTLCLACGAVVVMCNLAVCVKIRKRRRISGRIACSHIFGGQRLRNERQYLRTMVVVSLLYVICWVPFLAQALSVACELSPPQEKRTPMWLLRLFVLKFALDPFAYVLTREQYRRTLSRLILCRQNGARRIVPFSDPRQGPKPCRWP